MSIAPVGIVAANKKINNNVLKNPEFVQGFLLHLNSNQNPNFMNPTIGRIVMYKLTEADKKALQNLNRGNIPDELPAMVVAVWGPTTINVQVFLDGPEGTLWKTSIMEGDDEGNWHWPKRD